MTAKEFQKEEDRIFREKALDWFGSEVLYFHRSYRCACGYTTTSPTRIFEHACNQETHEQQPQTR